jgi:uncharacterized protein YggE
MGDETVRRGSRLGQRRTGITVTGTGSAMAAVDEVTVTLGVSLVRADAGEAFQAAAQTATRVLAILADDGADSRSVRTADLTLGPQVEWRDNREFLVGYQAGQRLIVHLTGLAGLERTLTDVAVRGGEGVRIENVALTPSNPASALAQARAAAFADALVKATQLAELAGRRLGGLSWIDERQDYHQTVPLAMSRRQAASDKMPIATGDTAVGASVTAHWSFADEEPR